MAIWIPDLEGRTGPKYLQIVEAMAADIAAGRLTPGTRLPPHRELAYQLGVSANTTSRAYAEAVRRALLRGEVGRGTFIRAASSATSAGLPNTLIRAQEGPVDLSRNLPFSGIAEPNVQSVLSELPGEAGLQALLDFQTGTDLSRHVGAGIKWLDICGVDAKSDEVVPTIGAQHGLLCVLLSILKIGDLLLTEPLTYTPVLDMAERLGIHCAQVEMDASGVIPESFDSHCRTSRPRAFYLTPTLQAPTTVTLDEQRRQEIAEIAARNDVLLIEDDVFGPLKQDRPAPLAARVPENVIYVTSLSKAVAPGLRVGYARAPEKLAPALRQAVNSSVWMVPPLTLEIATRLIENGSARDLAERQRAFAAHRQSLARVNLAGIDCTADPVGLHLWLPLPDGMRADVFRAQCAREGVLVSEARSFAAKSDGVPDAVRICISHEPDEARLKTGLQKIASLIKTPASKFELNM